MGSMPQERRLKVIIVGAGLGGCATALAMNHVGFDVVVYEKVRQFKRLGDSLGLGENALKLLDRWSPGLRDDFVAIGNKSQYMQIRRWENGELLAQQELMDMAGFIGHRGDYHDAFLRAVKSARIPLNMGQEVIQFVDGRPPSVELADGRIEHADVVIAADGIKSRARELVLGYADRPKSSGYACFRAFFDSEALKDDPVCNKYLQEECVNFWIGDDVHLVQNTLRNGQEFNWILTHKDTEDIEESWFQPGDLNQVKALITDLDPDIAGAVRMTPECLDWKICYRDPIPTWVSDNHHIALLGDCCHPHLPTSAQGASQATESAAVLAQCLLLAGVDDIALATRVYEKLRFPRVRVAQSNGEDLRDRWHSALKNLEKGVAPNPEDVYIKNRHLYDYDAEEDTHQQWGPLSAKVRREFLNGAITPLC